MSQRNRGSDPLDDEPTEVISMPPGWVADQAARNYPPPDYPPPDYPPPPAWDRRPAPPYWRSLDFVIRLAGYLTGLAQGLLIVRFLFRLMGVNGAAPAAQWVYALSEPLVFFFEGLLPEPSSGPYELELSVLVAVVFYSLVGFLVKRLLALWGKR